MRNLAPFLFQCVTKNLTLNIVGMTMMIAEQESAFDMIGYKNHPRYILI